MKVHKVTLFIADFDDVGAGIRDIIQDQRYPNHCISPKVVAIDTKEIEWADDHPLNSRQHFQRAFEELFGK